MNKKAVAITAVSSAILSFGSIKAMASDWKFGKDWSKEDTAYQLVFTAALRADWSQSRYITKSQKFHEKNPILGKRPSTSEVDAYFIACGLGHAAISAALPNKAEVFGHVINPRRLWQFMWIGIEGGQVINNASMGIKFSW